MSIVKIPKGFLHILNVCYAVMRKNLDDKTGATFKHVLAFIQTYRVEPTCRLNPPTVRNHLTRAVKSGLLTSKRRRFYFTKKNAMKLTQILEQLKLRPEHFDSLRQTYLNELLNCQLSLSVTKFRYRDAMQFVLKEVKKYISYDPRTRTLVIYCEPLFVHLRAMELSLDKIRDEETRRVLKQAIIKLRHSIRSFIE